MRQFRKVITRPGDVIGFETVFEDNDTLRTGVPAKKGTVERVDYRTSVYEDGKTYEKYCYVYLPYCYDPDDTSRKYNVLYYQHGNTCEPSIFSIGGNKPMLDMLFDSGEIEPCIIVSTTYYFDPMGDAEERLMTGMVPAGDGFWPGIRPNFHKEVIEDIIPAVEMRYNTYLDDPSADGIRRSRDHRCFSGYSRGAKMTWAMLHHCLEYFRWFSPMSCHATCDGLDDRELDMDECIEYITSGIKAAPDLPFYIYATNGGPEDIQIMNVQMDILTKLPCFSYGTDPEKNNIFYSVSDFYHTDYPVPYYYWNSLKVIFSGPEQ